MVYFDMYATTPEFDFGFNGQGAHSAQHHTTLGAVTKGRFGIDWPDAIEYPLFYIGVYAAIRIGNVMMTVMSVTAQYTGALRASRILFE